MYHEIKHKYLRSRAYTVKSQIQTAVSIDYFVVENLKCASNQGRLLLKFTKKYFRVGKIALFY